MTIYIGKLATTLFTSNGTRFSQECLADLVRKQQHLPVTLNFSKETIGSTRKFKHDRLESGSILVEFEIDASRVPNIRDLFVVPGGILKKYHKNEIGQLVLDEIEWTEVSITSAPADMHLLPVKEMDDKNV